MFVYRAEQFEGSVALLLDQVERHERQAVLVAVADVVGQFVLFLRAAPVEPGLLADVIASVARLMELKSRALLPPPPGAPVADDAEEVSPEELEAVLREYRRFKVAAGELRARESDGLRSFPRLAPAPLPAVWPSAPPLPDVTLDRLAAIVQAVLQRRPSDPPVVVLAPRVSLRERVAALAEQLERAGRLRFADYIESCPGRAEIIVGFMAVLELIKAGRVLAVQDVLFGDILLVRPDAPADALERRFDQTYQ